MTKLIKLLAAILALLLMTSCSSPRPAKVPEPQPLDPDAPLKICFDLDNPPYDPRHHDFANGRMKYSGAKQRQAAVDQFLRDLEDAGGPRNVEVEFIEGWGDQRNGQLTRLRTEIMAGEGPDLFLLRQSGSFDLIRFPEKKMEDGLFLCLDKYMENAQFMEPDKMLAPIFDAGKSADGRRFLLPMSYSLSAAAVPVSSLEYDPGAAHSFEDMLDGSLGGVLALWRETGEVEGETGPLGEIYPALGSLADYGKEQLSFTKEELGEFFQSLLEYERRAGSGEVEVPRGMCLSDISGIEAAVADRTWARDPVHLIPLYDRNGGVTARIDFYMAVNANSKNPAGAFCAADYMLGHDFMLDSDLFMYMRSLTLPIYADLLGPETPLPYIRGDTPEESLMNSFGKLHWDSFRTLTGLITGAEFRTELDDELALGYYDYQKAESAAAREKVVSEAYSTMNMMLGES